MHLTSVLCASEIWNAPCQVWPNLGLHWATMAKLAHCLDLAADAHHAAHRALEILQHTHSPSPGGVLDGMLRIWNETQPRPAGE